jgi:LacI family transcriptional regulator
MVFLKSQPDPAHVNIGVNNVGGARQATEHLLSLGRRHVAHLAGPTWWSEAVRRVEGWQEALAAADLSPPPEALTHGDWSSQSGAEQMGVLLDRYPKLDAVFVGNDQMALGALSACHERGIRIPDDVAIIGFDGIAESGEFTPSLSTMIQPLREMGELAVTELLAQATDDAPPPARSMTLDVELLARASTLGANPGRSATG